MTVNEISDRLDTLLNKTSQGIIVDEYIKSLYLTEAQSYFVDQILKAYEYGDHIRHVLGKLLVEKTLTSSSGTELGLHLLPLEADVKQIVYERTNDVIETIPMDYNDIYSIINNPFRKPSTKIAYRVTVDNRIKLYTSETFLKYYYIYCKVPEAIILENLPSGLELQGITTEQTSELPYDSILQIIEMASELIYKNKMRFAPKTQPQPKT